MNRFYILLSLFIIANAFAMETPTSNQFLIVSQLVLKNTAPETEISNSSSSTENVVPDNSTIEIGAKKYYCQACDKEFARCAFYQHIRAIHKGIKYPCGLCEKKFTRQSHLDDHIKSVHEGVVYTCNVCSKTFAKKFHLTRHVDSKHNNIKYPCTHCEKIYSDKDNLNRHIKKKHPVN